MKTLDEIRQELDSKIGMDVIHSIMQDQIRESNLTLVRSLTTQLKQAMAQCVLTDTEKATATVTLVMVEMYDAHTNIHALLPHTIVEEILNGD